MTTLTRFPPTLSNHHVRRRHTQSRTHERTTRTRRDDPARTPRADAARRRVRDASFDDAFDAFDDEDAFGDGSTRRRHG